MTTSGFYRLSNGQVIGGGKHITAPNYELREGDKDTHTYPVHGWYWFDSKEDAIAVLTIDPMTRVKNLCNHHIEVTLGWTKERQLSTIAGVYSPAIAEAMRDAIAASIAESNRCEDLIIAGQPFAPIWPVAPVALSYEETKS
jgi:hypothetical protein